MDPFDKNDAHAETMNSSMDSDKNNHINLFKMRALTSRSITLEFYMDDNGMKIHQFG